MHHQKNWYHLYESLAQERWSQLKLFIEYLKLTSMKQNNL
jgi:hypothetical protein